jgi:hypothetical protein
MSAFDVDKVIWEAPLHKSMVSLAKEFGMGPEMFKYRLMKERKLMLVKNIVKGNLKKNQTKPEVENG